MKKIFIVLSIAIFTTSCKDAFPYKFSNEPQVIDCPNTNTLLMNEAMYSFKDDIQKHFLKEIQEKDYLNFQYSYAQYIYRGAAGMLFYDQIISPHTTKVFKELEKQENLFIKKKGESNLNYQHEFVQCLINKIDKDELRNKIKQLLSVNYFSPEVMAENYRSSIRPAEVDPDFLMFIALDTYYQRFVTLGISETQN